MRIVNVISFILVIFGLVIVVTDRLFTPELSGIAAAFIGTPIIILGIIIWFIGWIFNKDKDE